MITLFEAVKQAVSVPAAAKQYGLEVKRGGMAVCPFHPDKSPSLKLNEDYYFCFGCGAHGDVIDLVANLFHLSNLEAAQKLAQDFGVAWDRTMPLSAPRPRIASQLAKHRETCTIRTLVQYRQLLQTWEQEFQPKSLDDPVDPRFLEAVQEKEHVAYLLDVLISGTKAEKEELCAERNPIVRHMVHRLCQKTPSREAVPSV